MLDKLPLEVVARVGKLERWGPETLLALSQVSKQYRNTVQALRPYAKRFELHSDQPEKADVASTEKIVN